MFTIARYQIHFLIVQSTHSMLFYTLKNTHTDDDLWCYELKEIKGVGIFHVRCYHFKGTFTTVNNLNYKYKFFSDYYSDFVANLIIGHTDIL